MTMNEHRHPPQPVVAPQPGPRLTRATLGAWFALGCGLVVAVQGGYLAERDWDATALLHLGEPCPARTRLERELGPITYAPHLGHDGKYFYLIARYPWFWQADAEVLEGLQDPGYRYARPLYPLLAGLGGTLSPLATLGGLIAVQVVTGGFFAVVLALLARRNDLPPLAVLLGLATPCVYSSSVLLTSDLLALTLSFYGVLFWQRTRLGWSVAIFAAAVLAKEYYALTSLTLAASVVLRHPRAAFALSLGPLVPLVVWKVALAAQLGVGGGGENFTWPGAGILATASHWMNLRLGALGVVLVLVALAAIVRPAQPIPRWQCVVWGTLGLCASERVWIDPADLLRVVSSAWWFAIRAWWPRPRVT